MSDSVRRPVRIGVDARLVGGMAGGVEHVVVGLARGLSRLSDGEETYHFLAFADETEWIAPHLSGPCRLLVGREKAPRHGWKEIVSRWFPPARAIWKAIRLRFRQRYLAIPRSDGTIESAGLELMHFPKQNAFITGVPSIFHPHDLQHLHHPEFFDPFSILYLEKTYRFFCEQARLVATTSTWIKDDLVAQYGLAPEKVAVVPLAPAVGAHTAATDAEVQAARAKFALPDRFAFYPAQTWPHKNHLALVEALALVRQQHGIDIPLVLSGRRNNYYERVAARARALGVQIHSVGFVTVNELQAVYRLATCVVVPSKFEAASFPLWEAFFAGAPAACSNVTSLPRQAADAALLFDPDRVDQIAEAVFRLWTDAGLRDTLVERGRRNVARFTWDRTARLFRAHYRRLLGVNFTAEDAALLAEEPLL
jgi:glycosyltransferase involved in cell wall biosynthesis